jgi:hypothetical protein
VIALLEEFWQLGLGSGLISEFAHEFMQEVNDPVGLAEDVGLEFLKASAKAAKATATDLKYLSDAGWTEADGPAYTAAVQAGRASAIATVAEHGSTILTVAVTTGEVLWGAYHDHEGLVGSIEQHSGDIADAAVSGLATAGAIAAIGLLVPAAPAAVVIVGGVAIGAVVAAGVGATVQTIVDHNRQKINHAIDDIGHLFSGL